MRERLKFKRQFKETLPFEEVSFEKGTRIVEAGKKVTQTYIVEEGFVKVTDINSDGHKKTIIILMPGQAFPLIWSFDHPESTVYHYEALTDVKIDRVGTIAFKRTLNSDVIFTKQAFDMFVHLSWDLMERVKSLQMPFTMDKVIRGLPYLASKVGCHQGGGRYLIPKWFTHEEHAQLFGTTRESISKHLKHLKQQDLLQESPQGPILDLEKIQPEFIFQGWFNE